MQLHFYGGAQSVTGSNYLLEAGGLKLLVDCGLFQGEYYSSDLNYHAFPYDPAEVDVALITHSHTDHVGRVPKLYRDGFRGRIITTEPTAGVIAVGLEDTLDKITDEAASQGLPPLYAKNDLAHILALVEAVPYRHIVALNDQVSILFHDASHVLGSALIEIVVQENGTTRTIVFSGDIGNPPTTLLNPIDYVPDADYLVMESAYGNRHHEGRDERREKLLGTIEATVGRKGALMIPSFAIERTQELLLELDDLFDHGRLPKVPFFVDSPLATHITEVYSNFSRYFNPAAIRILKDNKGFFQFPWLTFTPTVQESKRINDVPSPKIIIAGSGMSQGGRILYHEQRYLPHEENTILFVGYQVANSLGRRIMDGNKEVRIFGQPVPVRCHVHSIPAYSAHADQEGLIEFARQSNVAEKLKQVFVVQGEADAATALAAKITEELGIPALAPEPNYTVTL